MRGYRVAPVYVLQDVDGGRSEVTLSEFFRLNEMHPDDEKDIRALKVGGKHEGGAVGSYWSIERTA